MADDWAFTTDINGLPPQSNNTSDEEMITTCDVNYLPTVKETRDAMGPYGVALLVVGSTLTVLLYLLFFDQLVFTYRFSHKVYRRHIIWITSIYPFMTLMTVISVIMPRADTIASGIKAVYMCIGLSHFIDLTEKMFGSEKMMLAKLNNNRFIISTGPSCCCCVCLPTLKITQNRLRINRWMVWQMPYLQAIYFTVAIFWNIAESDQNGMMDPNNGYFSLQVFNLLSFMCGVWGLNIIAATAKDSLEHYNYAGKSVAVKTCVLVTRFQSFILDTLGLFDIYPCYGQYITPTVFKIMLEQSLYLIEMILLGPYTYYQFRTYAFMTKNPTNVSELPEHHGKDRGLSTISVKSMEEANNCTNAERIKTGSVNQPDAAFVAQARNSIAIGADDYV